MSDYSEFIKSKNRKILTIFSILLSVLLMIFTLSLLSGNSRINLADIKEIFSDSQKSIVILQIRLPRTLAALLGGAMLGISGAGMQGVLRNPLASPYTLGIAGAAAFGASFAIIILGVLDSESELSQSFGIVSCAFVSSIVCIALILWFGKFTMMKPSSLILAGVALGSLFHAGTMMLQFFATDINAAAALFWTFGDLAKATNTNLLILFIVFCISIFVMILNHWRMDALSFGDDGAKSRGVDVFKVRTGMLFFSALCASVVVAYFGIIGFIGLIAAHLVRLSIGDSNIIVIPFSALYGAILLMLADITARIIMPPVILPIGVVTSFMGVPLFLYLLSRKNVE